LEKKSYSAYKSLKGEYKYDNYILSIDHVQSDPYAPPSKMRIVMPRKVSGIPEENIEMNDVTLNGYNGQRVIVAFDDGTVLAMYFIKANGKLYSLTQEGYPKYQAELAEVLSTWHPNR